jgi:hypothetical protein
MRCGEHEAQGELEIHKKILVGKPKCKKQFRRPKRRWKGNTKMHFKEVECKLSVLYYFGSR